MNLSMPHSMEFHMKPPKVDPLVLTLKIPCQGRRIDVIYITIKNPGSDRIIYRMNVSKPEKFDIKKYFLIGFIDPMSSKKLDIFPRKLPNSNGFNKHDGFDIECAPAPKGDLWDPEAVWKAAKQIQKYSVKLKISEEKQKPKRKSKPKVDNEDEEEEEKPKTKTKPKPKPEEDEEDEDSEDE